MWLNAGLHALHLLAGVIWVGGMVFASAVLQPVLRARMAPAERLPLLKDIGLRYKPLQWGALSVLLATGLHKIFAFGYADQLFRTSYGTILGVKIFLYAAIVILSYLHSEILGPRLAAMADRAGTPPYQALLGCVVFWGKLNLFCNLGVIVLAAFLRMRPM